MDYKMVDQDGGADKEWDKKLIFIQKSKKKVTSKYNKALA